MSNPSNSTEKPNPRRTPRREVWWLELGSKNQSLESIKRRFEDCLDRFLLSSSKSLLRHITSPDNKLRRNLHQCPGYLREEITLTSDVSKSVIISHSTFPTQSEVCSICGQLVQYTSAEPSIIHGEKLEANSPNGSDHLPRLQPSGIPLPQSSIGSPIADPPSPVLSNLGSEWIPPSPTLPNHPRLFPTTLQLRDNRPEEHSGLSSLDLLNPDTFRVGRHRRKSLDTLADTDSNFSLWSPPFSTLSNRSVHFVPDTLQPRDNKPEENLGLSSQSLFKPDRFRHHRKLSDIDSGSGWIPRSPTLSSHSGRSGPSHNNKPEEKPFRFRRKSTTSSSDVTRSDGLHDYSHAKIPDNSSGGRRPLSGFFSSLATMLSKKPPGLRRNRSRQKFRSNGRDADRD